MKNFYEMYSLLKESTDEILNGLIKHIRDSNYEPWTFAMLADYLEKIRNVESADDFRSLAERLEKIRNEMKKSKKPYSKIRYNKLSEFELRNALNHFSYPDQSEAESLKRRMINYIHVEMPEADEFDIEAAIRWFACDGHGGQSDPLYAICSSSEYRPGRSINRIQDENPSVKQIYFILCGKIF